MSIIPILAVGRDPMISSTRISLLRGAGYAVESATSAEQAIKKIRSENFGLVILCHTIPAEERRCLARLVRASGTPIPVIYVQPLIEPSMDGPADAIIGSHPSELLSGVEEVLNKGIVRYSPPPRGVPKTLKAANGNAQPTDSQ
jgi:CheY-like chemotaxis protein